MKDTDVEKIDAHHHFWRLERGDYGWLTSDMGVLYQDYLPNDLTPCLQENGVVGTLLVQAAPTEAETHYLFGLAMQTDYIRGVVGWIDFQAEDASERVRRVAEHPRCIGLRPMLQDMPDATWILARELAPVFAAMVQANLTFDALIRPHQIGLIHQLAVRYPVLRIVVDHCAKPAIAARQFDEWSDRIGNLAGEANVFCKFSGLTTEAGPGWTVVTLDRYFKRVWNVFGPDRILWGSDWPVCLGTASYAAWITASETLTQDLPVLEQRAFFSTNAHRAYKI
ncbi:MAG: amidohydrolase family protein [Rhodobacteraceae bacterium]|nr:amidohydrolase family protein [Paracoccaceae bacterium]